MEQVLDVYKRPYDVRLPVVCMDESPRLFLEVMAGAGIKTEVLSVFR